MILKFPIPKLAVLVSAGLLAAAAYSAVSEAVSIKRVAKVGDKVTYKLSGDIKVAGQQVTITAKGADKVTAVGADGSITTESTQSDLQVNGMDVPAPAETVTAVAAANGVLKEASGSQDASSNSRFQNVISLVYPDKPVNVGDSWSIDVKADTKLMDVPFTGQYKLIGDEKIGSHDTWKIDASIKETTGDTPASSHDTIWIDKADGSLVKEVSEVKDVPLGGGQSGSGTLTLLRND